MKDTFHVGPSLAVKFVAGDQLLCAVGPFLHIYNVTKNRLIHKVRIFKRNKVHGIAVSEDKLAIYGGKSVSLVSWEQLTGANDVSNLEHLSPEWIVSTEFDVTGQNVFLLTCYNMVLVVDFASGDVLQRNSLPNERSILYSGSIKVLDRDHVLVNAGTVMGGIIVWDLHTGTQLWNLLGHEGSIFYVTVSDNGKYVASCSDDRSIRLWDTFTGKELSLAWGHTARIWNLKFFDNDTKLISVSEDCTCRIWSVEHTAEGIELIAADTFEVHLTKNVWGVDVNEEKMIAATSGNDGRIKLIDLKQTTRMADEMEQFDIKAIEIHCNVRFAAGEIIKGFHCFEFGIVALTSGGHVLRYTFADKSWVLLFTDQRFLSYSITNGVTVASHNVVIFSNNNCDLLLVKFTDRGKIVDQGKALKVTGLAKTTNVMCTTGDKAEVIYVTVESPNPRDNFVILAIDSSTLEVIDRFNYGKPDSFVSSCVTVLDHYILVGSRFSTVAIFDLFNCAKNGVYRIDDLNIGDTTTSIEHVETKQCRHLFSVTNRDGYYSFLAIKFDNGISHEVIHSNKTVKGFLERAFYNDEGDYVTYGFKSRLFYMYNESKCYEIMHHMCGGAHRQWGLYPVGVKEYILVYIKASQLHVLRIHKPRVPEFLTAGLHGREIRDLSICPRARATNENEYLFVTGSEDTSIKLNTVDKLTGEVTTFWTERRHISGLQRTRFISDDLLISCSALEELFLWRVDDTFARGPYIHMLQSLPVATLNPDLRIMDFDVKFTASGSFILATVYSDSSIKMWHYDNESNNFNVCVETRYKTCCILNTRLIQFRDHLFLLITATDGHAVIYRVEQDNDDALPNGLAPVVSQRIHQSGVKAVDVKVTESTLTLYTGGDDNGVCVSVFQSVPAPAAGGFPGFELSRSEFAHSIASATVTSCQLFDKGSKLLTTSIDQIVRVWDASDDELPLKLIESQYTTIADTGCCDVVQGDSIVLIGGVGLSTWNM
ncbi:tRNA (34-2'-O)-methyltransferase regulator RTT10 KNAG_0M00450 [Huiozyma naganishii CBS 8797]|uniref:Uncharacterized protein n=1 Tax=Huiozyma naganishii (strain ATCC MYA-139 / BCRC 22969 / CBS 8797 / KCTC 17520 / NBRC 10181 / NCYC 3082 / Yp74L-3) TaxID=1071383 RepID=J7RSK2_HUIN7|nr:hypothetical protein KNAG_0M00450 [Kazachstania naganishii CBS 8797]CCK72898.1 hypothetical protein KNAG_0M00450 [Kazachstania naganishii CBS 8797]